MAAMDTLLKRWGFVRISRYGLVLTPEGRIISLRPAMLDDGLGSRIVGWQDHDLVAMELPRWEPARPAAPPAVANRIAIPPRLPAPLQVMPAPMMPAPIVVAAVAQPVEVAEDEWEWEIALARARVAEDDVEVMRAVPTPMPAPRRTRQDTVPPPLAATPELSAWPSVPSPRIAIQMMAHEPIDADEWPTPESLRGIDYNDYTSPTNQVTRASAEHAQIASPLPESVTQPRPRAPSPSTIIPVPRLPRITDGYRIEPVVRALPTPIPPQAPRRFPKGTGPVHPTTATRPLISQPPPIHQVEDTSPGIGVPRAVATARIPAIPAIPAIPSILRTKQRQATQG